MLTQFGFRWSAIAVGFALALMSGPVLANDGSNTIIPNFPPLLSLNCAVVGPKGEQGNISLAVDERTVPAIKISLSTLDLDNFTVEEVTAIATEVGGDLVRQFQVKVPLGSLALRLLRRGTGWGVELAPVEWSILSGPLVTGRCLTVNEMPAGLKPYNTQTLSFPVQAVVGMAPEGWAWGAVEKKCRIVSSDIIDRSQIEVSAEGELTYIDSDGTLFKAKIAPPLISSEFGYVTVYQNMALNSDKKELRLRFNYRQGRFWIDGSRSVDRGEANWFRGVCISDLPN